MDEIQFADGFDAPDRLAFGLGAGQLLTVVAGGLLAYAVARSPLPTPVAMPIAASLASVAAVLESPDALGSTGPSTRASMRFVRVAAGSQSTSRARVCRRRRDTGR